MEKLLHLLKLTQNELKREIYHFLKEKKMNPICKDGFVYAEGDIPILLVAHMDTVFKKPPTKINYNEKKDLIYNPHGGLGGDDRCGVYAILKLLEKYKPHILFTEDEEIGCIGETPMDTESDDWDKFLKTAKNLNESIDDDKFETDYGCYLLICIASIKPTEDINTKDIKLDDVEAIYSRKRSQITITKEPNKEDIEKINKIIGIKSYFDNTEYKSTNIPKDSIVCIGDNWYIIYNSGTIISSHVFDFDEKAVKEFNIIKDELGNRIARSDNQASKRVRKPIVQ